MSEYVTVFEYNAQNFKSIYACIYLFIYLFIYIHPAPVNGYGLFPGGKVRPWLAADHSPPSSAAVMVE